ncbi:MAG: transglycosylase domain-containing protein [Pseudanabaenaceae cyanobacterium]
MKTVVNLTHIAYHRAKEGLMGLQLRTRVPRLEVQLNPKQKPEIYDLVSDTYLLGRSSSKCDIHIPTPIVSQVHAQIRRDRTQRGAKFVIIDQNSTNGIFIHGRRVKSAPLRHNLKVSFGPPELADAAIVKYIDPPPWYLRTLKWTGIAVGTAFAGLVTALAIEVARVPDVRPLPVSQQGPVQVLASDGTEIGPGDRQKHTELRTLFEFGQFIPNAVIASEDSSFYWNIGIDPWGIMRALVTNVRSGEVREGASTITQQLARNLLGRTYVGLDDSPGRKWREAAAAIKLNLSYSKEEILTIYLNRVYLGNGVYGFQDAALLYFGKSAKELDLSEAATLAGILPAPNRINPFQNKELAIEYRNRVLNRMVHLGMISEVEAERARRSILRLNEKAKTELQGTTAPYFYSYVFAEMQELLGEDFAKEGGLIVETALDLNLQRASDRAIQEAVVNEGRNFNFNQGAILTIDFTTGRILAMTGGVNFQESQFNRAAQAKRQAGSTFKLFAYTAALEKGVAPTTTFACTPIEKIAGCRSGSGDMDMVRGFALSENVVAIRVAQSAGYEAVMDVAKRLGIKSLLAPTTNLPLGGYEVSMLELVGAFGAIANQGVYYRPHAIVRIRDGRDCQDYRNIQTCRVIFDSAKDIPSKNAVSASVASQMMTLMGSVVTAGTGRAASLSGYQVVGKTGTTDRNRDLWFVGIVPERKIAAAVWLGNDEGSTDGSSALAAQVFADYLSKVLP